MRVKALRGLQLGLNPKQSKGTIFTHIMMVEAVLRPEIKIVPLHIKYYNQY